MKHFANQKMKSPWLPRDVVRLIRDRVARSDDGETLLAARLVAKDWNLAVTVLADPVKWCHHLQHDMSWRKTEFLWPVTLERGLYPFDLPPFVLEVLLLNQNGSFRDHFTWLELVGLAQRMVRKKDPRVEELEREAWLKMCGQVRDAEQVEEYIVMSIMLWGGGSVDWFCAGVQTLLLTPAFHRPMLSLLKGAQRHWFPLELSCAEICLELLRMGVWCKCENSVPPPHRGVIIIIKKRRTEEDRNEPWFNKPNALLDTWTSFPMLTAWRLFIGLQLHRDELVLHIVDLVRDPELLNHMEKMNTFGIKSPLLSSALPMEIGGNVSSSYSGPHNPRLEKNG
jgi:hypothetical protein